MGVSFSDLAKIEVYQALNSIQSKEELDRLKQNLSEFFAARAEDELDKLWDDGVLDQKKLDELRSQHLRTAY